jgi:peptide subunit release factor 1 (eRF1)
MLLSQLLDRLAGFTPTELPVLSLYLNAQADQHGRDSFASFVRKELPARAKTYPPRSTAHESFDRDAERIKKYLQDEVQPSTNGIAIFACAGAEEFFEAVQLEVPVTEHQLYVDHQPHLYPLARLLDQYQRYAVLLADTNAARLFVFGTGEQLREKEVHNTKVSHTRVGGWSQARYQRHVKNYHLHHAKEVVDVLRRVVQQDKIERIILAGDDVIIPVLREQMPPQLLDKVIDVLRLDMTTPEHEIVQVALESLREQDTKDDAEKVRRLLDEFRSGGLAVVGTHDTLAALANGQVDELVISATVENLHAEEEEVDALLAARAPDGEANGNENSPVVIVADELVTRARQSSAQVTFIENAALLADVGGVGARLRYRL